MLLLHEFRLWNNHFSANLLPKQQNRLPAPLIRKRSNIKRHRIPAPELSFSQANLPFLIQEVERAIETPQQDQ
jgi:hypothetical protein